MANGNCTVILNNNTIAYNSTKACGGGICTNGNGGYGFDAKIIGKNNIIHFNTSIDGSQYGAFKYGDGKDGCTTLTYTCISQKISGKGNISNDPLFVNPEKDDFRLRKDSPCINAGKKQDGTITNMGAL
jgi:hypothetical protein